LQPRLCPVLICPSSSKPPQFVTIIVSKPPTEQKFVVHKELICFHSPFFHAAFNGKFTEGQTQEMRMDDVDEETFGQLVHWL
jgi:BTB/POZ domain